MNPGIPLISCVSWDQSLSLICASLTSLWGQYRRVAGGSCEHKRQYPERVKSGLSPAHHRSPAQVTAPLSPTTTHFPGCLSSLSQANPDSPLYLRSWQCSLS